MEQPHTCLAIQWDTRRHILSSWLVYVYQNIDRVSQSHSLHELPRIFETPIQKTRVQGAERPCRGSGCPRTPLFPPFLRRRRRREERRKRGGDTPPPPAKGLQPLAPPLEKGTERPFEKFGVTHGVRHPLGGLAPGRAREAGTRMWHFV